MYNNNPSPLNALFRYNTILLSIYHFLLQIFPEIFLKMQPKLFEERGESKRHAKISGKYYKQQRD